MLYLMVINQVIGPINMIVCSTCLLLLFFEAAFGICLGCRVYNWFNKEAAQLCPGGSCALAPERRTRTSLAQIVVLLVFFVMLAAVWQWVYRTGAPRPTPSAQDSSAALPANLDPAEQARCKVPEFAKAMGHEEKWKLHNNCR
jgi:cbb3-type cytochrome oxidase subunit 3